MNKEEILAMEAGEDLDRLVAIEVMGEPMPELTPENALNLQLAGSPVKSPKGNWLCLCRYEEGDIPTWRPLPFSTDISAAFLVVEAMMSLRGYNMSLLLHSYEVYPEPYWYCDFRMRGSHAPPAYEWVDHQKAAPEAICKAALIARLDEIKKLEEEGGKE